MEKTNAVLALAILAVATFGAGLLTQASIGGRLDPEDDPDVKAADLDGKGLETVLEALAIVRAAAPACPYEDQSGGFGGQSGQCTFACPGTVGTFMLDVRADDPDATVSGTASCGPHDIHCSGSQSCDTAGSYKQGPHEGACRGDSDEFYDSGFYLNCSANGEDKPKDPGEEPVCIIYDPRPVCIEPELIDVVHPDLGTIAKLCSRLDCEINREGGVLATSEGPGAMLLADQGSAFGFVCDAEGACHGVVPTISTVDGRASLQI